MRRSRIEFQGKQISFSASVGSGNTNTSTAGPRGGQEFFTPFPLWITSLEYYPRTTGEHDFYLIGSREGQKSGEFLYTLVNNVSLSAGALRTVTLPNTLYLPPGIHAIGFERSDGTLVAWRVQNSSNYAIKSYPIIFGDRYLNTEWSTGNAHAMSIIGSYLDTSR